jgi:hypothetical protein
VPIKKDICPEILKSQVLPPDHEVLQTKTYHYHPCPPDADFVCYIPNLHQIFEPGEHLGLGFWQRRTPKKLHTRIAFSYGIDPVIGWGLHIVEGPNWVAFLVASQLVLLLTLSLVVLYSALTEDVSAGFGIGSYVVTSWTAILTLYALGFAVAAQNKA